MAPESPQMPASSEAPSDTPDSSFGADNSSPEPSNGQAQPQPQNNQNPNEDPIKLIQKLTGKLTQKLRDGGEILTDKNIKYVINSILSAIDMSKLTPEDKESMAGKFNTQSDDGMGITEDDNGGNNPGTAYDALANPAAVENKGGSTTAYDALAKINEDDDFDVNNSDKMLFDNPSIKEVIDIADLDFQMEDNPTILAFDVCEAIHVYIIDYNEDCDYIHDLRHLLGKVGFRPSPLLRSYDNLDEDAKSFYNALIIHEKQKINSSKGEIHMGANINEDVLKFKKMISEIKNKI